MFERLTEITAAFDRRHPDARKNYGIHGAELRMIAKGQRGATQFVLFTTRNLPHIQEEMLARLGALAPRHRQQLLSYSGPFPSEEPEDVWDEIRTYESILNGTFGRRDENGFRPHPLACLFQPMPADLGYHSPTPRYEDQDRRDDCPYLNGRPCYYDGSGLNAFPVYELFLEHGMEAAWKHLETFYRKLFEETPAATK